MTIIISTHPEFERQFKRFVKKYHSLIDDYADLLDSLKKTPHQGDDLGGGLRKVRMGIDSKGGGKSGGMRVITYSVVQKADDAIDITLLYIYDKSEMGNVSVSFLRWLLNSMG
jgi:hypothetical protein